MRNIAMLETAKNAPAMPPLTAIFDTLICGLEVSSLTLHLLKPGYQESTPPKASRAPMRDSRRSGQAAARGLPKQPYFRSRASRASERTARSRVTNCMPLARANAAR